MNIYTDGSCRGNPGPGGWGVYCITNDTKLQGYEDWTTNNRMEMMAVIKTLEYFSINNNITIYTDSTYVKNGITKWIHKWKQNNWKTSTKSDVKNKDLWIKMSNLLEERTDMITEWKWVKGHSGSKGNEIADKLAKGLIN